MDRAEAVDLLRRLRDAQQAFYAGGDEAPFRALFTDDICWHVPGRNAIAGDYQGDRRGAGVLPSATGPGGWHLPDAPG